MSVSPLLNIQEHNYGRSNVEQRVTLMSSGNRNALSTQMIDALLEVLSGCKANCLTLQGLTTAFSSGLDLKIFSTGDRSLITEAVNNMLELYLGFATFAGRTRCYVTGPAVGGGVGLAMVMDEVICHPQARFSVPTGDLLLGAKIIHPIVHGRLPGCAWPFVFDSTEAVENGLVTTLAESCPAVNPQTTATRDPQLQRWIAECRSNAQRFLESEQLSKFIHAVRHR